MPPVGCLLDWDADDRPDDATSDRATGAVAMIVL